MDIKVKAANYSLELIISSSERREFRKKYLDGGSTVNLLYNQDLYFYPEDERAVNMNFANPMAKRFSFKVVTTTQLQIISQEATEILTRLYNRGIIFKKGEKEIKEGTFCLNYAPFFDDYFNV